MIGDNLIAEAIEFIKESASPNNIDDLSMVKGIPLFRTISSLHHLL
jgi:hypothetical protein